MTPSTLTTFWRRIFNGGSGRLCVAGLDRRPTDERINPKKTLHESYYRWPEEGADAEQRLTEMVKDGLDPYFCAHLLTEKRRGKAAAAPLTACYVDGDGATIPAHLPHPTITVESSPDRHHYYWILSRPVTPAIGEEINHRLAAALGADMSGWDLSQLLRPPSFVNRKHVDEPTVTIVSDDGPIYAPEELLVTLPPVPVKPTPARPIAPPSVTTAADTEIIDRLRRMRNGRWGQLYDTGELTDYGGNWSNADQGLANGLVAACDGDSTRADQLFRQSMLMRDKWDEVHYADGKTYGQVTLDKALAWYQSTPHTAAADPIVMFPSTAEAPTITEEAPDTISPCAGPIAALEAEVTYWKNRALQAEGMVEELREIQAISLNLRRNKHVKTVAATAQALAFELASAESRGVANEDGTYTVRRAVLAENSGHSPQTITDHLAWFEEQGFIAKETPTIWRQMIDRSTGEVVDRPSRELHIRPLVSPRQLLKDLAVYTPHREEATHWGGKREPCCPKHPNAGTVRRLHCAVCDDVLEPTEPLQCHLDAIGAEAHSRPDRSTPMSQDDTVGIEAAAEALSDQDDTVGTARRRHGKDPTDGLQACAHCGHVGRYEVCAECVKRTGQTSEREPVPVMPDAAPPAEDDEYEEWRS